MPLTFSVAFDGDEVMSLTDRAVPDFFALLGETFAGDTEARLVDLTPEPFGAFLGEFFEGDTDERIRFDRRGLSNGLLARFDLI